MRKLSAVIITYNEERNIADCIRSVQPVADEIVLLDSYSNDKTEEIARSMGAKFFQHAFDGHIQQKNRVIEYAQYPWLLSLDADERLSPELQASILALKQQSHIADGYKMNRLNFLGKRAIKSCGWYPDRKLRLWVADKGQWTGRNPHDEFVLHAGGSTEFLSGDLLHYTYADKNAMCRQVEKFAEISAKELQSKSNFYLFFKWLFSPGFKFIKTYFFQAGIFEGSLGFFICRMQSREVRLKYGKALWGNI